MRPEMTNHLQRLHHRRELRLTELIRCLRRRDMRTVREADLPLLWEATAGGCVLSDHFSVVGPGDT